MKTDEQLAAEICRQNGLDFAHAHRAGGWTNCVWIVGDVALRLSREMGSSRIRREIALAKWLPAAVKYPECLETGEAEGREWCISRRVAGVNLSEAWPGMRDEERASAVAQIADMLRALQSVKEETIAPLVVRRTWYSALDEAEALALVEKHARLGIISDGEAAALTGILKRFFILYPTAPKTLCHGDLTTDNLLWNAGEITSLLDFEHAAAAPKEMDVQSLINLALFPDEGEVTDAYRAGAAKIVSPFLSNENSRALAMGYAALFWQWFVNREADDPDGDLSALKPYHMMRSLADGRGGYFGF